MKRLLSLGATVFLIGVALTLWGNLTDTARAVELDEYYRTFIDEKDREIEAKLVKINGDTITIQRKKDGKQFKIKVDTLSRADQTYVRRVQRLLDSKNKPDKKDRDDEDEEMDDDDGEKPIINAKGRRIFAFQAADFRTKKTKHFLIKYNGRNMDPARSYSEKVWTECSKVMPDLEADFERGGFCAPGEAKNGFDFDEEDGKFRFRMYVIDDNGTFVDLTKEHIARYQDQDRMLNQQQLIQSTGMFEDFENRYLVHDMNPGRGGGREAQMVHGLASSLLQGQSRRTYNPLWLAAGMGYYIEHQIFDLCRVHYLDFQSYYENQAGKLEQGEILSAKEAWTRPLRKMAKADKTQPLSIILNQTVADMTPEVSGYTFALTCFMLSDDSKRAKYHKLIKELAGGAEPDMATLLRVYGYDSAGAFEKAWYEFMKSAKFR